MYGHLVKAMVFPVVMYGCESWSIKKAERRRIDAFELWCWRRLLSGSPVWAGGVFTTEPPEKPQRELVYHFSR